MTTEELKIIISAQNDDFKTKIDQSAKSLADFGAASSEAASQTESSARRIDSILSDTASSAENNVGQIFGKIKTGIAALGLGKLLKDSISSTMDAVESDSLFETSLGRFTQDAREWSEGLSQSLGLNAVELRKNAGILYTMTNSMGLTEDTAYSLSRSIVQLSQDMASFYNLDSETAFTKLRSGLTGETEPLKQLGILVDEATVKQYAYSTGIAKQGEELTNQQKILGRYTAIMAQTATAQGDLARTIDSPANQLRVLQNEIDKAELELGQAFMPLVQTTLPILTEGVRALTPLFTKLAGGVEGLVLWWDQLNPIARGFLQLALVSAVAVPAVTAAIKLYTAAQLGLHSIQALLIPQTLTLGTVTKAAFGWIALAAGALALLTSFGSEPILDTSGIEQDVDGLNALTGAFDSAGIQATDAASGIGDVSDEMSELGKQTSKLAGFDELNILNTGSGTIMGKLVSDKDVSNLSDFESQLTDIDGYLDSIGSKAGSISLGGSFSPGFVKGLETAEDYVEKIFGPKWTKAWERLGMDMFEGIENGNWIPLLKDAEELLKDVEEVTEQLFGSGWNGFWEGVGSAMYEGIHKGNWFPLLESIDSGVRLVFGHKWDEYWNGVGSAMYDGIHSGDWLPFLQKLDEGVRSIFGSKWSEFWEDVGGSAIESFMSGIDSIKAAVDPLAYKENNADMPDVKQVLSSAGAAMATIKAGGSEEDAAAAVEAALQSASASASRVYTFEKMRKFIKGFASGGFPDYGELFIANENGPEMVGRMGSRNVVANNSQITTGIANAVESVMSRYFNGRSERSDVYVFIDGEEISNRTARRESAETVRRGGR